MVDVLRGALASLRTHAMGKDDDGGGEGNDANDDDDEIGSGLLPLPHCQLLALLWHSLSDGARAELLAQTAAILCDTVDSGVPTKGAARTALVRLHVLLDYFVRHFDGVPPHVPQLFHARLGAAAPAAAAAAAADVAGVGLHLAPAQYTHGAKAGGTAVVAAAAPAAAASPAAADASPRRKLAAAASARPAAAGAAAATASSASFFTVGVGELFELGAPPAADGSGAPPAPSAAALDCFSRSQTQRLHAALSKELLALHGRHNDFPPLDSILTPAAAASQVGAARALAAKREAVLRAQHYDLAWRLLGALPAPPAPADAAMAVVGDATPHTARLLLDRLGSADGGAPADALRRAALLLSGAAAQADGCAEAVGPPGSIHALHRGPDGEHDTSGLGRATAMCSALALCVGAAAAAATPPPAADGASLVPATGAGMIPGRPTAAASDAEVRELLGSLASSVGALAGVVRTLVERAVDAKPPSAEREQLGGRYGGWYASLLTSRKLGDHARASGLLTPEQSVAARLLAAREPTALLRAAAVREAAAPQLLPLLLTHALARPTLDLLAHGSLGGGDAPARRRR